ARMSAFHTPRCESPMRPGYAADLNVHPSGVSWRGSNRAIILMLFTVLVALAAGCGDSAGEAPEPDVIEDAAPDATVDMTVDMEEDVAMLPDIEFPPPVVAVETVLEPTTIRAGERAPVSCQLLDAEGNVFAPTAETRPTVIYEPDDSFVFDEMDTRPIAVRAGQAIVTCTVPTLGLRDRTPETLTIGPAAAVVLVTDIEPDTIAAGETTTVSCRGWDAFGNEVDVSNAEVLLDVTEAGITIDGRNITIEPAGV